MCQCPACHLKYSLLSSIQSDTLHLKSWAILYRPGALPPVVIHFVKQLFKFMGLLKSTLSCFININSYVLFWCAKNGQVMSRGGETVLQILARKCVCSGSSLHIIANITFLILWCFFLQIPGWSLYLHLPSQEKPPWTDQATIKIQYWLKCTKIKRIVCITFHLLF